MKKLKPKQDTQKNGIIWRKQKKVLHFLSLLKWCNGTRYNGNCIYSIFCNFLNCSDNTNILRIRDKKDIKCAFYSTSSSSKYHSKWRRAHPYVLYGIVQKRCIWKEGIQPFSLKDTANNILCILVGKNDIYAVAWRKITL